MEKIRIAPGSHWILLWDTILHNNGSAKSTVKPELWFSKARAKLIIETIGAKYDLHMLMMLLRKVAPNH